MGIRGGRGEEGTDGRFFEVTGTVDWVQSGREESRDLGVEMGLFVGSVSES